MNRPVRSGSTKVLLAGIIAGRIDQRGIIAFGKIVARFRCCGVGPFLLPLRFSPVRRSRGARSRLLDELPARRGGSPGTLASSIASTVAMHDLAWKPPSVRIAARFPKDPAISADAKALRAVLGAYSDGHTGRSYVHPRTLEASQRCGRGRREAAKRELACGGWLRLDRKRPIDRPAQNPNHRKPQQRHSR
jgi:hypothetical protein